MKIKGLLGYSVPLFILFLLLLTVQLSEPPESAGVKACRLYAGCIAIRADVPIFLNLR
ncbi:hypothetical protein PS662_01625 [Pseudomonas fluorescens]|uniref:Uncharacterized protein n=1 Tax=Pseudomonas fluorescens TaxID=294 RepID=A0A5E6RFL6_PSEFL|nr:hypothetical protein PS662_01625 [Pseudomonas fluorescens]